MSLLLHIESSTEVCSTCLSKDGEIIEVIETQEPFQHGSQLTVFIDQLLKNNAISIESLDGVVVSSGPGSYTGLRIGVSVAKGICYGLDIPLIPVDTLQSLANATIALNNDPDAVYFPMIDARRMEVYTQCFSNTMKELQPLSAKVIDEHTFDELIDQGHKIVLSGNGSPKLRNLFPQNSVVFMNVICSARHLVPLGDRFYHKGLRADLPLFSPIYVKPPNITKPKQVI